MDKQKVKVSIASEDSELLESFTVTGDIQWMADLPPTAIQLAERVRDHIERRFECEEEE